MDAKGMDRRRFLTVTATGAAVATTGIEGILAARRAPAFAQGTKLHWVRWVDFIPESDVELKRQMPEASKALGAEVTFEFINANDLQPRITAAVQSGSGADIIQMLWNWPHLYANALVDVSDVGGADRQEPGRVLRRLQRLREGGRQVALGAPRGRRPTPSPTGARGSTRSASRNSRRRGTSTATSARSSRPRASPSARRSATRSATRRPSPTRSCGPSAAPRRTRPARRSSSTARARSNRSSSCRRSGRTAATRAASPGTTRTTTARSTPARSRDAERRLDLHRRQAAEGQDQGRQGRAAVPRTSSTRR